MTFDQAFDTFADAVLPAGLSPKLVERLRQLGRLVSVERCRTVNLGGSGDHFIFLTAGATKLVAQGTGGGDQILDFQFPGDFACVPGEAPNCYSLVAIRAARLLVFRKPDIEALAVEEPALFAMLAARAMGALQRCRQHLVTMGRRSATERVAGFLMGLARIPQVAGDGGKSLRLPMTRREIADSLGLTVETVSRQFSLLRERELIETPTRSTVRVNDWKRLARCAGLAADGG